MLSRNFSDIIQREKSLYRAGLLPPDPGWPVDVQMVMDYLHEHLFQIGLTAGQAKQQCGTYDHNICGRFAHYVGRGIKDYILTHRLTLAKRLLQYDDLAVTRVAFAVGYKSPSGFSTTFSRHIGCTPTEFRKRQRCSKKKLLKKDEKRR